MGRGNFFQFKQFKIVQEKAAMKVGIDGVLLGAWADLDGSKQILDIGTGTGLLALMAAQQSGAKVDAVEIDNDAAEDARLNFENSAWSEGLNIFHTSFQDFQPGKLYDHIISNPPFFENSVKAKDDKRTKARHAESLTLNELLQKSALLLSENGKISLVLPAGKENRLINLLPTFGLQMTRLFYVAPDENKKPHRILVELAKNIRPCEKGLVVLRDSTTNEYTSQYKLLTRDFYLAF